MTDIATLKSKLLARQAELSDLINDYVADHEGRQTVDSFVEVADIGEQSVNDFLKDMDVAMITQEVKEVKAVNSALRRIEQGGYGICFDCGKHIKADRLNANPTAERCIDCQTKYETEHATKDFNPSL